MTRVSAPTRLHFGLLHVPTQAGQTGTALRRFGGVGLMLASPRVVVRVERATHDSAQGPHAARAFEVARRILGPDRTARVVVEACPAEHTGLGVGTQLSLAVADAVQREFLSRELGAQELAHLTGRGERSAIGVHGYAAGGLLIDGGKSDGAALGGMLGRVPFPDWPIVLVSPAAGPSWSGEAERRAFARERDAARAEAATGVMRDLLLKSIWPALLAPEYREFGEALHEYNRLAGEPFAADQGGVYASPEAARVVATLREAGVLACGQSSWGPTIFGICETTVQADLAEVALHSRHPDATVTRTSADNAGRIVTSQ